MFVDSVESLNKSTPTKQVALVAPELNAVENFLAERSKQDYLLQAAVISS